MSFIILGDSFTYPEGAAATNRVHTYAKGFGELGIEVHIICLLNDYRPVNIGEYGEINYYYTFNQQKRNNSVFVRSWFKIKKYATTLRLIKTINRKSRIKAINLWSESIITLLFAFLIKSLTGTKIYIERSEHPYRFKSTDRIRHFKALLRVKIELIACNGYFCISDYLRKFYLKKGVKINNIIVIPSTVDKSRFEIPYNPVLPYSYILYCGSLTLLKDGLDILVESYSKIRLQFPDLFLVLIGSFFSKQDEDKVREIIHKNRLDSMVKFLGVLPRDAVPAYITNAKLLALARPASLIAEAGFPSKLTEYLASGKPVLVTKVGEIPEYLKHKYNAFLAEPGDASDFAEKIKFILENYELATQTGIRGKKLVESVFDYKIQTKRMLEFIDGH